MHIIESEDNYGQEILEDIGIYRNTKINFNKREWDGVDKNNVRRDKVKADFCENGHEHLCSINCVLFLYSSGHYYLEENDSALW
jgi:hypothetical protein